MPFSLNFILDLSSALAIGLCLFAANTGVYSRDDLRKWSSRDDNLSRYSELCVEILRGQRQFKIPTQEQEEELYSKLDEDLKYVMKTHGINKKALREFLKEISPGILKKDEEDMPLFFEEAAVRFTVKESTLSILWVLLLNILKTGYDVYGLDDLETTIKNFKIQLYNLDNYHQEINVEYRLKDYFRDFVTERAEASIPIDEGGSKVNILRNEEGVACDNEVWNQKILNYVMITLLTQYCFWRIEKGGEDLSGPQNSRVDRDKCKMSYYSVEDNGSGSSVRERVSCKKLCRSRKFEETSPEKMTEFVKNLARLFQENGEFYPNAGLGFYLGEGAMNSRGFLLEMIDSSYRIKFEIIKHNVEGTLTREKAYEILYGSNYKKSTKFIKNLIKRIKELVEKYWLQLKKKLKLKKN